MQKVEYSALDTYKLAIRNQRTRKQYTTYLKLLFEHCKIEPDVLITLEPKQLTQMIKNFFLTLSNSNRLAPSTIHIVFCAVKLFFEINDIILNWKQISRSVPKNEATVDDRLYTLEEIKKLLDYANLREQVIIYTLLSTGMRIGALCELKLSDIEHLPEHNIYKFLVYATSKPHKYITFCTPECATTIDKYIQYRKEQGETITPNSAFIARNIDKIKTEPLQQESIEKIIARLRDKAKLFHVENKNERTRYPVMRCHGFRKIFNTKCIDARVSHYAKEKMMGHKTGQGLDIHYFRPTEQQLLTEYLKVINHLTVSEENRLKSENYRLKKKQEQLDYQIADIHKLLQKHNII